MAIVQISRITHRRGLQENLPQYLAGGELGWSVDSQRLFIGNGTLAEGAPTVGNTEILTEHSDIFNTVGSYYYKGLAAGYEVQTGEAPGENVYRTLQSKLDDFASVRDFGAVGDGSTDDTAAINRALYELFCRENTPLSRRSLFFPAGEYRVSSSILIPTYAKVFGEGVDSTIISYSCDEWDNAGAYNEGVGVIKTTGGVNLGRYRSLQYVPAGIEITDTEYWEQVDGYVARTADNRQQIGPANGVDGRVSSRYIEVSSMSFSTIEAFDADFPVSVFLIESATHCTFRNVGFAGPNTTTSDIVELITPLSGDPYYQPLYPDANCVIFSSPLTQKSSTVTLDTCVFTGQSTGVFSEDEIEGITISNSSFDTLYTGIVLQNSPSSIGPTGVRSFMNRFDNIWSTGITFDGITKNMSGYNMFYNVALQNGVSVYYQPCLIFTDTNNVSVGDMFTRTDAQDAISPRISLNDGAGSFAIDNGQLIKFGTFQREIGRKSTLANNQTSYATIFYFDAWPTSGSNNVPKAIRCEYSITRSNTVRTGTLVIVGSLSDSSSTTLDYYDDYIENADTGVTLRVTQSAENISVQYVTNNIGEAGEFRYSLSYLSAPNP